MSIIQAEARPIKAMRIKLIIILLIFHNQTINVIWLNRFFPVFGFLTNIVLLLHLCVKKMYC